MRTTITCASAALLLAACAGTPKPEAPQPARTVIKHAIIPAPLTFEQSLADTFTLRTTASMVTRGGDEADRIGEYLAALIGTTKESTPLVLTEADSTTSIELIIDAAQTALGAEGYDLRVTRERATITAATPAGLFFGVQTFRQLLPASVEYTAALARDFRIPTVHINDVPRYEWRGVMLDVSRHFLPVQDVESFLDLMSLYKLNRLHLHLADDQGWRIEIPTWPNLTKIGGSTEVGGGAGGFYTTSDYQRLVKYAADRFITIVPEIDMPGHTNAALASYPELNCDSVAPPLYTGTKVGFSVLCVDKEIVYKFIDDVVAHITSVTPGPFFHIGGDEVKKLGREKYNAFIERAEKIVASHGKRAIAWSEAAPASLPGSTVIQSWIPDSAHLAAARGSKIILSPARRIYLDMQYDTTTPIGLHWAAYVPLRDAYDWEPTELNPKLPAGSIYGLEGPLWAETLGTLSDYEYMAVPRMTAVAELAWSAPERRIWAEYAQRVLAHEARWTALGVNYRRSNPGLTQP